MLAQLSLDEFLALASTAERVAVFREISADRLTPVGIVEALAEEMRDGAILESGLRQEEAGRYSFIAFDSMAQLRAQQGAVMQRIGDKTTVRNTHPFTALRQLMTQLACAGKQHAIDFVSGAVGFIAYDAVRYFEAIPARHTNDQAIPDMLFNFYRTTLMFDHVQQKLLISRIVETGADPQKTYQETQEKITQLIDKITASTQQSAMPVSTQIKPPAQVHTDISDTQFMALVEQAKEYIKAGDAFQIVLSRCFKQPYTVHPFEIYRALRQVSPAPYMFYLPVDDSIILGASPERLISVYNQQVTINPIAGTRRRTAQTDNEQLTAELLSDPKEVAEHRMLVDLARNDLGAVCEPGSITIKELLQVKHFSHVSHITSVVTGQLCENKDVFDALAAAFPAGTLSGAPKIRAMQIIDELETSRRNIYGGAICRLDFQGNFDSCIAIRMAMLKDGTATVRTGAGIVYDSDPQAEANETRQKAQSVLAAIAVAQEGLA